MIPNNKYLLFFLLLLIIGCKKEELEPVSKNITIFFVNDQHGQIDNFSKVKHIIDQERLETEVIVSSTWTDALSCPVFERL